MRVCACAGGCGSCERGGVLAALSRIEELDFEHKAGDVTASARNMCFTRAHSECVCVCQRVRRKLEKEACFHLSELSCALFFPFKEAWYV